MTLRRRLCWVQSEFRVSLCSGVGPDTLQERLPWLHSVRVFRTRSCACVVLKSLSLGPLVGLGRLDAVFVRGASSHNHTALSCFVCCVAFLWAYQLRNWVAGSATPSINARMTIRRANILSVLNVDVRSGMLTRVDELVALCVMGVDDGMSWFLCCSCSARIC